MKTYRVEFISGNADVIQADHYQLEGPWVTFIQRQQGIVAARFAKQSLASVEQVTQKSFSGDLSEPQMATR